MTDYHSFLSEYRVKREYLKAILKSTTFKFSHMREIIFVINDLEFAGIVISAKKTLNIFFLSK